MANQEEIEQEKQLVYRAATELISIRGLDVFIDYLQEVQETGAIPQSSPLDGETYLQVLRQAVKDYRQRIISKGGVEE